MDRTDVVALCLAIVRAMQWPSALDELDLRAIREALAAQAARIAQLEAQVEQARNQATLDRGTIYMMGKAVEQARVDGVRLGIEAAWRWVQDNYPMDKRHIVPAIRQLDPIAIAGSKHV